MENRHYTESQIVSWSVAVLCATLLLVYVILYFVKWDLWKQNLSSCDHINTWDVVLSQITSANTGNSMMDSNNTISTFYEEPVLTWKDWLSKFDTWITLWIDTGTMNIWEWDEMIILPWTRTYYWDLNFVEKLWISYKYALVDDKWIYYLNMWDYKYDFSDIIRKLWWNLYIMNTEQEILQNAMFGDKVTYINVPEYKNSKVLILLDINNQSWLLAIDYSIYHQVKTYLKSLFITTS